MYRYYIGSINNIHGVPPVSWFLTSLVLAYIIQLLCKINIHTGGHEKLIINTLGPYPGRKTKQPLQSFLVVSQGMHFSYLGGIVG